MSRAQINIGPLPSGVGSVLLEWRDQKSTAWHRLGVQVTASAKWTIPAVNAIVVRATPRPSGEAREANFTPAAKVTDKITPKSLTFSPTVTYGSGVIKVKPKPPPSTTPETYTTEVRVSKDGDGPEEAVYVGEVAAGDTLELTQRPETVTTVHTRPFRDSDGRGADWLTTDVVTPAIPPDHVEVVDHAGTDFSGWTSETLNGYTPLGAPGGGGLQLEPVPPIWNTTNTDSIWGATDDVSIWGMKGYFPVGEVTSGALGPNVVHDFLPVSAPNPGTHVHVAEPIWGWAGGSMCPDPDEPNASATFREGHQDRRKRLRDFCIWNTATEGEVGPMEVEAEIATSQDGAAYTAFAPMIPGARYRCREHKRRYRLRSRRGRKQLVLDSLPTLRWIRNLKAEFVVPFIYPTTSGLIEYTFSPVPEFTTTPTVTVTVHDAQNPVAAADHYEAKVEAISTVAIEVRVYKVVATGPTWSIPAVTDLNLHIIAAGY